MIAADRAVTDRVPPHRSSYAWAGALAVMRAIKQALDLENMMNPGKMLFTSGLHRYPHGYLDSFVRFCWRISRVSVNSCLSFKKSPLYYLSHYKRVMDNTYHFIGSLRLSPLIDGVTRIDSQFYIAPQFSL